MSILATSHRRPHAALVPILILIALFTTLTSEAATVAVDVVENRPERIVIDYRFGDHTARVVDIDGQAHLDLQLGCESLMMERGAPALPDVSRSFIIPDDAHVSVRVLDGAYHEVRNVRIAPSRGHLLRSVDRDAAPHVFGAAYARDAFHPGPLAELGRPYILRDHRGVLCTVNPFQYNPVTRVLRVYTEMTVEIVADGMGEVNVRRPGSRRPDRSFRTLYARHFVNFAPDGRYDPLDEDGDLLIIAHDAWLPHLQRLATHKIATGIDTQIVPVSSLGGDAASIKAHVQSVYDTSDLAFLLLAGDVEQVPTFYEVSDAEADPVYALLAGDDTYPDIMVGRFSAEIPEHMDTQVDRVIAYETLPATEQDWYRRGMGIGSDEGPGDDGEMDWEHVALIREDLLAHGFTEVDELYDPGAAWAAVGAGLNAGRGVVNYCGHGGVSGWSTTGFGITGVDALSNVGMLPWIISCACSTGDFGGQTCFGESWLRATHLGEPSGGIACYAASWGQYWDPPMAAQDEIADLFVTESHLTLGTLCYAGSCLMMDEYPVGHPEGSGVDMFYTWILFGDPSLRMVKRGGLTVTPLDLFAAEGAAGGPFAPESITYRLLNRNAEPLAYDVSASASWLDLDDAGGVLPPHGETEVTASFNAEAGTLPNGAHDAIVDFVNLTDHDGDTYRRVRLQVGISEPVHVFDMDEDPGWSREGEWAFGAPAGLGGDQYGQPDPAAGATGANVCGVDLEGDYDTVEGGPYHLTTDALDCSGLTQVKLRFKRWLNTDYRPYVHATIEASNDGETWVPVWENPDSGDIAETAWSEQVHDLSEVADDQSTLYLRWGYEIGMPDAFPYAGWNIDDVEILGFDATVGVEAPAGGDAGIVFTSLNPNPSAGSIAFAVEVPAAGPLRVSIVDLAGRVVRTLHAGSALAGRRPFLWDGHDDAGVRLASGVYFIAVEGAASGTRKVVLIR